MFKTLDEYHQYIETNTTLEDDNSIKLALTQLRDATDDEDVKKLCSYEIYLIDFKIIKNSFRFIRRWQTDDGIQEYPSLELFDDNLNYLKLRATEIQQPKLCSKYNHILWLSKDKNISYAKDAINSYYDFLTKCPFRQNDVTLSIKYISLFENLFLLSQQVSYRKNEVLDYLVSILGTGRIHGYQEYALMGFIAAEGKKIPDTLHAFFSYANLVIDGNIFPKALDDYLKLQLVIARKINQSTFPFHNRLAEFHLEKSIKHVGTFAIQIDYLDALREYKNAGNKVKVEEVSLLMEKAKDNLNLKSVPFNIPVTPAMDLYFKNSENQINRILTDPGYTQLYEHLISSPDIFPKAEHLDDDTNNPFTDVISVMTFDHNRNIGNGTPDMLNSYSFHMRNLSMGHLSALFQKSYLAGKFSFDSISDFILNNTWYGEDAANVKSDGTIRQFKWAQLILPALEFFFSQTEIDSSLNKYNQQAYILCIDSLTLKFEGLLREFSRRIDAQTIEIKGDTTSERIGFEKLFDNPKFIDSVPADDIALFRYVFTDRGINLRNNIAHCFYLPMDYRVQHMWLLISVTLKLGAINQNTK